MYCKMLHHLNYLDILHSLILVSVLYPSLPESNNTAVFLPLLSTSQINVIVSMALSSREKYTISKIHRCNN